MSGLSKGFQAEWVARLFSRFQAIYGNRVTTMWGAVDPLEVQQVWADELTGFETDDVREAMRSAMASYPDYPPTLPQFVGLCRDARAKRAQTTMKLPPGRTPMPDSVRAELAAFVAKHKAAH